MGGWTAGEAQIVAALSNQPQALTKLIGQLDGLNADIASHEELEFGLRRLIAADYVATAEGSFRLTRSGSGVRGRGSKGIRYSRLLHEGITRELVAAGPPPAPDSWRLPEQEYDQAVANYHARMEPFVRWLGMTWGQRARHLFRRRR